MADIPAGIMYQPCQHCGVLSPPGERSCFCGREETSTPQAQATATQGETETLQGFQAPHHGGHRIVELWTLQQTEHLINTVKELYPRLTGKFERRRKIWKEITLILSANKPGITDVQVENKWKNLKLHFIKYEDNKKKTGASRMREPHFYNLMCSFLLDRPAVSALHVVGAGLDVVFPSTSGTHVPSRPLILTYDTPPIASNRVQDLEDNSLPGTSQASRTGTPNLVGDLPLVPLVAINEGPGDLPLLEEQQVDDPNETQEGAPLNVLERERRRTPTRRIRPPTRTQALTTFLQEIKDENRKMREEFERHNRAMEGTMESILNSLNRRNEIIENLLPRNET